MTAPAKLDTADLVRQVKALYRQVAQQPSATYHFPLGRPLAEQLGYPAELLDRIPAEALASFAGVGYALDLAALTPSKRVLDLSSGPRPTACVPGRCTSGSCPAGWRTCRSATPRSTWSSPTAWSTCARTRPGSSPRRPASSRPAGAWPWPTSWPPARCLRR